MSWSLSPSLLTLLDSTLLIASSQPLMKESSSKSYIFPWLYSAPSLKNTPSTELILELGLINTEFSFEAHQNLENHYIQYSYPCDLKTVY